MKLVSYILIFIILLSCNNTDDSNKAKKAVYIKPSIDYKGGYHKGYVRMPFSSEKNRIKSQSNSRYYYHTYGKYRHKK